LLIIWNKKDKTQRKKDFFKSTLLLSINERVEKSSFHIIGDSITFLSGDFTEKIKAKTTIIVPKITIITFLSEILFIRFIYLDKFFSGVVFS